jgi:hypothetical protein
MLSCPQMIIDNDSLYPREIVSIQIRAMCPSGMGTAGSHMRVC